MSFAGKLVTRVSVFFALGLLPAAARANVSLQTCGMGATVPGNPAHVTVIYWVSGGNPTDPNNEYKFDQAMLQHVNTTRPNPGDLLDGASLIGTGNAETVTQYAEWQNSNCTNALFLSNQTGSNNGGYDVFYAPSVPTCAQEMATVDAVAQAEGIANTVYVLQYGPGITFDACNTACAYHTFTTKGNPYLTFPYVTSSMVPGICGDTIYDYLAHISHEYAEVQTDLKAPVSWTGWSGSGHWEIGDGPPDSNGIGSCEDPNNLPLWQTELFPSYDGTVPWLPGRVGLQPLWSNLANQGNGACVYKRSAGTADFYLGGDGQIWVQQDSNNSAIAWGKPNGYSSGVRYTTPPVVATWGPYRFDLFGYDTNHHLNHIYQGVDGSVGSDDWGAAPNSGIFSRKPAVASWGYARLDLFATVNTTGAEKLYHRSWDMGTDSGWVAMPTLSAGIGSAPAAVSSGYGAVDVFVWAGDGNVYRSTSSDGTNFGAWVNYGKGTNTLSGDPSVASWGPGRFDVFFTTSGGGSLSHLWIDPFQGNGWDTWPIPSGVTLTGSPAVTAMGDLRLWIQAPTTAGGFVVEAWDWGSFAYGTLTANFSPQDGSSAVVVSTNNTLHP